MSSSSSTDYPCSPAGCQLRELSSEAHEPFQIVNILGALGQRHDSQVGHPLPDARERRQVTARLPELLLARVAHAQTGTEVDSDPNTAGIQPFSTPPTQATTGTGANPFFDKNLSSRA